MPLPDDQLTELALLAFIARQRGWNDLADRIDEDITAVEDRINPGRYYEIFDVIEDDSEAA